MALQVWLPLNGNLNNQGIDNTTVTNNGAVVDNNGKIGKCYNFDGTYISFNRPLPNPCSAFTVCGWVKLSTGYAANNGLHLISFETSYGRICISKDGQAVRVLLNYNGTTSATGSTATASSISANVWNHYAVTFDSGKINIYINGQLDNSYTVNISQVSITSSILKVGTYGGESSKGYVNDFRLYDRALAPKEIEILSRGLVCHYPLNGGGRGGDNMCTWGYTRNPLFSGSAGTTKLTDTDYGEYRRYTCTTAGTSGGRYGYPRTAGDLAQGTVYTWSAEFRASKPLTFTGSSYIGMEGGGMLAGSEIKIGTGWTKLSKTWTQTTSQAFVLYPKGDVAVGDWIDIRNLKIEVGDKATPYIPNPADTAYTAMGYNSTTEYDVSGYGNNMTKTGTITYTTDSIRYNVTSHFINGSYLMANQNCGEYLPKDGLTVNIWVKPTTWGTPISCTEGGGWNFEAYNNILQFQCYISGVGYKGSASTVAPSAVTDGKWHMLTGVFDRAAQQTRFYIDGELKGTNATGSTNGVGYANNRLIISGEAQSTTPASSTFVGEESDVRIYATALSDTQIAELYNTAVSVANNGTLMGYELVEG